MRGRLALIGIVAMAVLSGTAASDAAAAGPPSAPELLAAATQPPEDLALLAQSSGPLGLPRKTAVSELKFTNRDGFRFSLVAFGQTVALSVSNGGEDQLGHAVGRSSTTTYLAHGKVTSTSIQASFADRGRIALRFRPSGKELRASRRAGCRRPSGSVLARLGLFVGELRFRGEGGYTSARIHRARGGLVDLAALFSCLPGALLSERAAPSTPARHSLGPFARGNVRSFRDADSTVPGVSTHPSRGPKPTTLVAGFKLPLSGAVFGARLKGDGPVQFLAAEGGSEGQIAVVRLVGVSAPQSAFTFDDSLAGAVVAPPTPFAGTGVFQQGIGGAERWTGSLAVSFLGAPHVPLTGSPFRSRLFQRW